MLVGDGESGNIDAISSSGAVSLFATVPLAPGQTGLRQMAFAPAGFGIPGLDLSGDLIVSVSGSSTGGGQIGAVDAINSSGQVVAQLIVGSELSAFDPRGLYFVDSNTLLINDADPGTYVATPSDFAPYAVPEPSSAVLLTVPVLVGLGLLHRPRRFRA
jgi:hypothetical protein